MNNPERIKKEYYMMRYWRYKMSKADKMFEELGYIKYEEGYYLAGMINLYGNNYDKRICFWNDKTIEVYDFYDGSRNFTMQELQAINEKVKELGWLDVK